MMALRYLRIIEYVFADEETAATNLSCMTHNLNLPNMTMRSSMLPMEAVPWSEQAGPPNRADFGDRTRTSGPDLLAQHAPCPQCGKLTVIYNGNYFCAEPDPTDTLDGVRPSSWCGWMFNPEDDDIRPWLQALIEARREKGRPTDHIERVLNQHTIKREAGT